MPVQPKISLREKLQTAMCSNPKRSSLVVGLAVVVLLSCGGMLFSGPALAPASLVLRPQVTRTESSPSASIVSISNPVLDWLAQPKAMVNRNLFAIHFQDYAGTAVQSPVETQTIPVKNNLPQPQQFKTDQSVADRQPQELTNHPEEPRGDHAIRDFVSGELLQASTAPTASASMDTPNVQVLPK